MGSDKGHPARSRASTLNGGHASEVAALSAQTRHHLGQQLRTLYGSILADAQPQPLLDLLARLETALALKGSDTIGDFRRDLIAMLPSLRAFAVSLAVNSAEADDLVQETLLKAWTHQHRFTPGTNFKAWLFTILRNQFYTEMRKRKREVEDADGTAAGRLVALPSQEHGMDLQKVWTLVAKLPVRQREALMLVSAQGLTYEAAAELLVCPIGSVKSRVSRARSALVETLNTSGIPVPA